jgi:hypothetical protein
MTDTASTMNHPTTDQIKALQTLETSIRKLLNSFGVEGSAAPSGKKARGGRAKKTGAATEGSADGAEAKPKREINPKIAAMNEERKAIFEEMKATWAKENPSYASLSKEELKKAIAEGKVAKPPGYPDALKEHSRRMGEKDPAHAQKAAERRKAKDDKKSEKSSDSQSTASAGEAAPEAPKKKRGPKKLADMTPEERAAHDAKKAAKKAAKDGASTSAPAPAPAITAPAMSTAPAAEVVQGDDDDPETFKPWSFEGKNYFKNDLGYVYDKISDTEPGEYVGRFHATLVNGKRKMIIDTTVPEPSEE